MSKIVRIHPSEIQGSQPAETQDNNAGTGFIGYYKPNVPGLKAVTPSGKNPFKGRILPCYDLTMDTVDSAFKTGVASYRVEDWVDPTTGVQEFSEFMVSVPCYTYFGKSKNKFVSPSARYRWSRDLAAEDVADPVADVIKVLESSSNPAWQALIQRNGDAYPIIPAASPRTFVNMWGLKRGERSPYNAIVDVSGGAMYDLKDQLNYRATTDAPGRDPKWPQFLLGDVTDPETGIVVTVSLITSVPQRKKFNGFIFQQNGGNRHTLEGISVKSITTEVLAARQLLLSDESVFKILSYQELVDFILEDGAIPQEVIKTACSHMANVTGRDNSRATTVIAPPVQRVETLTSSEPFAFEDPFKASPVVSTPAPSAPPAPVAPTVVEASYFHVVAGSQTTISGKLSEIQEKLNQGYKLQVWNGATWLKDEALTTVGLVLPEAKVELPPPPPVAEPAVTAQYIPAPPQEQEPKKEAKVPETIEFEAPVAAESKSNVSAEDVEWYKEACIKLQKFQLPPEDMLRWVNLDAQIKASNK